jgi:hypothetical protein
MIGANHMVGREALKISRARFDRSTPTGPLSISSVFSVNFACVGGGIAGRTANLRTCRLLDAIVKNELHLRC